MSTDRCPLAWKAAALEDGRLDARDRPSFEQHAKHCAECRGEQKALRNAYASLRSLPVLTPSPLDHARRRGQLMARANERFLTPRSRGRIAGGLVTVAVVAPRWALRCIGTL